MRITWSDLRSIQKQTLDRLKRGGDTQTVAVGLGVKNAHKRPRKRRLAVVLVVRRKVPAKRLPKSIRMGKRRQIRVEVGRGRAKKRLTLPTDVIVIRKAIPTAAQTRNGQSNGSAGVLIFWRSSAGGALSWGLL